MKRLLLLTVFTAVMPTLTAPLRLMAHDPIGTRVTWTGDIDRLFRAHCVGCHKPGSTDPMPLATYEQAQPWASAIRQQVLNRRMPIWHAARGFGDFANDPSLSPFDIALITTWVNAGAPRGDEKEPRSTSTGIAAVGSSPIPSAGRSRTVTLACGLQPLSGRLLAINPMLAAGASATITARLPNGRDEIVAWILDYDRRYPTTYWLRTPLTLPRGSGLEVTPTTGECQLTATLAR